MHKKLIRSLAILPGISVTHAQLLRPGFDKQEYSNLMKVSAQFGNSSCAASIPPPPGYRLLYRSPRNGPR